MDQYEYKVLILGSAEELEPNLNALAGEGWRLAFMYPVEVAFGGHNLVVTLERPRLGSEEQADAGPGEEQPA
ncbi:MAG TPA: DUF4177 domain-containing protein [Firmicutes bacterium]|uniref:DUF4177 domain-containing protein n=1 Tax=Gelria sp. Kuro-4 TaxID=2796927 RepID=UPI001991620B|nr:DUF4177 domain-containing protein [Gelria sp. Kuro-4]MDI3522225.1 hypothetical protein [Bacillota bacterium]MDK2927722.1 hypothetical protein [Bacillota bacterium]BCV23533.1 hypothetical protein kuro4_03060 [Gelria sp. Kuro-4]HHV57122.1 DUF4177 domain-containing protein [Bacillota bacterium]